MARRTILIVDDTPDHLDILRRFLQSVGFHVVGAAPGSDALARAAVEPPDLILAAIALPGHPAWETALQLRAQPGLAQTPILGTTVYNTLLNQARLRSIGCADYVQKPFNMDELLYQIGRLLPEIPFPVAAA